MGDKGGKKDKEKSKKQTTQKSKQSDKKKADKQPAKKAWLLSMTTRGMILFSACRVMSDQLFNQWNP